MNRTEYVNLFIANMEKLEGTFARGMSPILNSIWMAAAKEVESGNVHGTDIVVDRFTQRERDYIIKRYKRTADIFGRMERDYQEKKSYEIKAPLNPYYWFAIDTWAKQIGALRVTLMNDHTKSLIARAVLLGLKNGDSGPVIAKNLRIIGITTSKTRANLIARTETHTAAGMATKTMAQSLGAEEKSWQDAGDRRVRTTHRNVDGGDWIPVEERFNVGGEMLDYPGDPAGSADNVCRCRCTALYRKKGG